MPPSEAQGVYSGTSYLGINAPSYIIVLPNETYYAFYQDFWGENGLINMMVGKGESANGTYTAHLMNFIEDASAAIPVTLTATYVPGTSIAGSLTYDPNGFTTTFNATALPAALFEWDTPANLSHIVGVWPGRPVTVDSNGTFTGWDYGCSVSGMITPSPTNKNFFNVTITYGVPCPSFMAGTGSGIAIETLLADGITRQLLVGGPVGQWRFIIEATR